MEADDGAYAGLRWSHTRVCGQMRTKPRTKPHIISARRGGLSTAIDAGVPEAILWMQSGHAQDVAARRYVQLRSPKLLYRMWEAFKF